MINVSILKSIYDKNKTIKLLNDINEVDMIHLDLMDGLYSGENNINFDELKDICSNTTKPLDVHLMVNNPENIIDDILKLNPKTVIFHPDASNNSDDLINKIKSNNVNCGIAFDTPVDFNKYTDLFDKVDVLLLMSVKAGYGGQEFLNETFDKLDQIRKYKEELGFKVEVDGGIDDKIYHKLKEYDVDYYVIGSYICMNENFKRPLSKLLK